MSEKRLGLEWAGSCYGIDIQGGKPVIVRAERTRGHVDCFPVSATDPSFAGGLKSGNLLAAGSLAAGESFACWLEVPFPTFSKALKVLPTLLDVQLPFPLEDCVYSFIEAGKQHQQERKAAGSVRSLAIAARTGDVLKKIELYKSFDVDPAVLDHEGVALWTQSLEEVPAAGGADLPRVVIYLGVERSTMVIGRGGEFISAHSVGQNNTAQIGRLLKAQLKAGADRTGAGIQWMWAGPGANDQNLLKKLQDGLRSEWPGASVVHDRPESFLARAVATRALVAGPMRCNLRSGAQLHPLVARRDAKETMMAAMIYLAAGILLCAVNIAWGIMISQKESSLEETSGLLADKLAGYHVAAKGEARVKVVRDALNPRREMLKPFLRCFEPSLADTIVSMTDLAKKNDLCYEILSISRDKVNVSGTAGNWKKCDVLLDALKQYGYGVKMDRKEALVDARVAYSIVTTGGGNE